MESKKKKLKTKKQRGITLIALVVTIVVLLILASVSITVVFGDNGILELAKEAGEKTNEAVQGDKENIGNATNYIKSLNWDTSKVTAVTTKDGGIVPVPKGFVGSEVDGENTIKDGFVIYEGIETVTDDNVNKARTDRNQFVWIPADGVSLEYKKDTETWKEKAYNYNDSKDWWDEEAIEERKESVVKYGGFYVGRYEAGVEESKGYNDGDSYQASVETRNISEGTPVTKKGRQAWNFVTQANAKKLSEKIYENNAFVTSRLIDSYAWDTICTWLNNSDINVLESSSWGNYLDTSYKIKGLYAKHSYSDGWTYATTYSETDGDNYFDIPESKKNDCYEVATGISERNKQKNIYDFAGNMWEWTTEEGNKNQTIETNAIRRGGAFDTDGCDYPACCRVPDHAAGRYQCSIGFRYVLYIN